MPGQQCKSRIQVESGQSDNNVVHIYQVRPEMALEHLRRSTGLEFDSMPENLVRFDSNGKGVDAEVEPPLLTDVVDFG